MQSDCPLHLQNSKHPNKKRMHHKLENLEHAMAMEAFKISPIKLCNTHPSLLGQMGRNLKTMNIISTNDKHLEIGQEACGQ